MVAADGNSGPNPSAANLMKPWGHLVTSGDLNGYPERCGGCCGMYMLQAINASMHRRALLKPTAPRGRDETGQPGLGSGKASGSCSLIGHLSQGITFTACNKESVWWFEYGWPRVWHY